MRQEANETSIRVPTGHMAGSQELRGREIVGSRVAISGAGGPMGRAIALRLLAAGANELAITDISARRLLETAELIASRYPKSRVLQLRCDITKADEAGAFAKGAMDQFGGADVLVNVVGGLRSARLYTPFLEMDEAQWRSTLDLNLMGNFHLIRALVPGMLARGSGRVINVATIVFGGEAGQSDYAAAKAAVASLTRSLAAEFAPGVTVNAVAPGLTRTSAIQNMPADQLERLTELAFNRRMAEPEEIADAVAFFASESARFLTGEILAVSGGIHPHL